MHQNDFDLKSKCAYLLMLLCIYLMLVYKDRPLFELGNVDTRVWVVEYTHEVDILYQGLFDEDCNVRSTALCRLYDLHEDGVYVDPVIIDKAIDYYVETKLEDVLYVINMWHFQRLLAKKVG